MQQTDQLTVGLPKPYLKYSEVLELSKPLNVLEVEQPNMVALAKNEYLAEVGTMFNMSDVQNVKYYRQKISGKLVTGIRFDLCEEQFTVPKFAVRRFITRLFGSEVHGLILKQKPSLRSMYCECYS